MRTPCELPSNWTRYVLVIGVYKLGSNSSGFVFGEFGVSVYYLHNHSRRLQCRVQYPELGRCDSAEQWANRPMCPGWVFPNTRPSAMKDVLKQGVFFFPSDVIPLTIKRAKEVLKHSVPQTRKQTRRSAVQLPAADTGSWGGS